MLVGHDWGGVLAVDWARRHPDAVRGIAYLETLVAPVSWAGPNAPDPALFGPLRGPGGERLVLAENVFVEKVLQAGTVRTLTGEEMDTYRAPYREPGESRRPTLTWPREIPIDGEPPDVHEIVTRNARWMVSSPVPKLFVNGDPGALLTGAPAGAVPVLARAGRGHGAGPALPAGGLGACHRRHPGPVAGSTGPGAPLSTGGTRSPVPVRLAEATRPCGRPTRASRTAPRERGRPVGGPARRRG